MTGGLDGIDLRILAILQENAERSISEMDISRAMTISHLIKLPLGLNLSTIKGIESGHREPQRATRRRIARVLQLGHAQPAPALVMPLRDESKTDVLQAALREYIEHRADPAAHAKQKHGPNAPNDVLERTITGAIEESETARHLLSAIDTQLAGNTVPPPVSRSTK